MDCPITTQYQPALADTLPGQGIRALQQTQASTWTAPIKADKVTACQTQDQAISTTLGTLNARVRAAQATNDPAQMRAALLGRDAPRR